jgi:Holliday junction resolvasome RuvABC endonuclease subunit
MLLAIDASTSATGYAFGTEKDGAPRCGLWKLPGGADLVFDRTLAIISESVSQLCNLIKPNSVVIEAPLLLVDSEHSAYTTGLLVQLTGAVRAAAARAGATTSLAAVSTVRKTFIGERGIGRAEAKRKVMERCRMLGWDHHGSDDIADAMATWYHAMATRYPKWKPGK